MDALEVIKSWKDGKMERWMEINRHRRHRRRLGCNGRNQLTKACPLDPLSPIVPFPDKFQGKKQPTSVNRIEKGGHDEHSRWEASHRRRRRRRRNGYKYNHPALHKHISPINSASPKGFPLIWKINNLLDWDRTG